MKINKFITSAIIALSITACAQAPEEYSDAQIVQARNYVNDYETRIEKMAPDLLSCANKTDATIIESCRATVYDLYGFNYDVNKELSSSELREYKSAKNISFLPLSSELK